MPDKCRNLTNQGVAEVRIDFSSMSKKTFTVDNITTKRPGTGISPMKWNMVLGRKAIREFEEDELIEMEE